MSAFKNKSYNPLWAPLVLSKERLTFLQGLNPVGVRNARVEAANLVQMSPLLLPVNTTDMDSLDA